MVTHPSRSKKAQAIQCYEEQLDAINCELLKQVDLIGNLMQQKHGIIKALQEVRAWRPL